MFGIDYLKDLSVTELEAWYRRLASKFSTMSGVADPLAGKFLLQWLDNRVTDQEYIFNAPQHLKTEPAVIKTLEFHRDVFLTKAKAHFNKGAGIFSKKREDWVGILPRIQDKRWDMKAPLTIDYECLCDPAPTAPAMMTLQRALMRGDTAKTPTADIALSLRGFQLKSVPDYMSREKYAVKPDLESLTVYHSNALRLERAQPTPLAAPFKVKIRPWAVGHFSVICAEVNYDITRKLP